MTNAMDKFEERIEQIEKFASQCYEDGEKYSAFIAGAIWADNNPVNVWHDASEEPKEQKDNFAQILYQDKIDTCRVIVKHDIVVTLGVAWEDFAAENISRWAYIDDLLPKGGEK